MKGEDKKTWTRMCGVLLSEDYRSYVQKCEYSKTDWGEVVTITYKSGDTTRINVNGNSQGAILHEIVREVYGDGAIGRTGDY